MKNIDICSLMEYELKKFRYLRHKRFNNVFFILDFDNESLFSFILTNDKAYITALLLLEKYNKDQYNILKK